MKNECLPSLGRVWALALICLLVSVGSSGAADSSAYEQAARLGRAAAASAISLISAEAGQPLKSANLIVMTDAGYAELGGQATVGALDGLASVTGVSRGRNTLVEMHASFASPLWFAVYDKSSGYCAYLEAENLAGESFKVRTAARVDVGYLRVNSESAKAVFDGKPFSGNEFRIITAANAIASGAPVSTVRAFEFHDHFCPGVSAGILTVEYIKQHFVSDEHGYFVHSLDPWCKDDALLVLLNATPGKLGYAVIYPSSDDNAAWQRNEASTIVYRHRAEIWEGLVLAFDWVASPYPKVGNTMIDYLNDDIWYLQQMSHPEKFVKVVKRFEMPKGSTPIDWSRPGEDPLKRLGLVSK